MYDIDRICMDAFKAGVDKLQAECKEGRIVIPSCPLGNNLSIAIDDIGVLKRLLWQALQARTWFRQWGTPWDIALPLNAHERRVLRDSGCWRQRLVAEYAWSLQGRDYQYYVHPLFYDWTCGRLLAGFEPPWPEEDANMFRPKHLEGLDAAGRWKPLPDRGSRMLELQSLG